MEPSPLEPVDESWDRALVVVAHPDDVEFGAAAAVARWTGQGKTVVYCMVTSGEAGIDALAPDVCRGVRMDEQIASASIVGADTVEFLGLPDGVLEYGVSLRRAISAVVRKHRPEIIVTNNFRETWGGSAPNQPDHMAVGRAALNAASDAGNRWIFPEQLVEGLVPWGGVKQVWAAGSPDATHAVDTTDTFDRGVESLAAHKAYIDGLGWEDFDPAEFLAGVSRPTGSRLGTTHAAAFEVFNLAWGG
ncbi:PIG-L deacetylase family protein [Aeromicrobium chenweiae]|uniref:PIG-L domain-containing protein n=1 Tax=Aeromicrobium chenweiae TaxID=2079793 RepID=A0A2S0WKT5_9ACTN|nr:PIG-L deacetylase family protein [Aeromicrobium chenweiae]AWB91850.1 PIG-L domain-containing protein [Aeromicrobium chenweiae]TGN32695.1 PIG-L family deacetylase [Aeromicrobium chenweiae]